VCVCGGALVCSMVEVVSLGRWSAGVGWCPGRSLLVVDVSGCCFWIGVVTLGACSAGVRWCSGGSLLVVGVAGFCMSWGAKGSGWGKGCRALGDSLLTRWGGGCRCWRKSPISPLRVAEVVVCWWCWGVVIVPIVIGMLPSRVGHSHDFPCIVERQVDRGWEVEKGEFCHGRENGVRVDMKMGLG